MLPARDWRETRKTHKNGAKTNRITDCQTDFCSTYELGKELGKGRLELVTLPGSRKVELKTRKTPNRSCSHENYIQEKVEIVHVIAHSFRQDDTCVDKFSQRAGAERSGGGAEKALSGGARAVQEPPNQ
ncbi:hypothetical protein L1887_23099 [Cichorium endivia]|nr:hypothetical protein L1887_23099 [Cichorium endivia]